MSSKSRIERGHLDSSSDDWVYGKELLVPSTWILPMVRIDQRRDCGPLVNVPNRIGLVQGTRPLQSSPTPYNRTQCLLDIKEQSLPCSPMVQSQCSYIRFEPLFDLQPLYRLEKNHELKFLFLLHTYQRVPILVTSTKSNLLNYSVNYTIDYLKDRIIRIRAVSIERTS